MNFEEIYGAYENPIYNYVLKMVKEKQTAQDLTQDIFLKIYRNLSGFRADASLSTEIYKIA